VDKRQLSHLKMKGIRLGVSVIRSAQILHTAKRSNTLFRVDVRHLRNSVFLSQKGEGIATEPLPDEDAKLDSKASSKEGASSEAKDPQQLKIDSLGEEVSKLKKQVQEVNNDRLRLLAEMENVRTIAKRDVDLAKTYGMQSFSKKLLEVVDNLNRAVQSVPEPMRVKTEGQDKVFSTLYEGIVATEKEMLKLLAQNGIESFGKVGEKFDPNRHEAMLQTPATPGVEPNSISSVLKVGFMLKDRVLRPAQVAIAVSSS
jgi:molecular chaperone GrpE